MFMQPTVRFVGSGIGVGWFVRCFSLVQYDLVDARHVLVGVGEVDARQALRRCGGGWEGLRVGEFKLVSVNGADGAPVILSEREGITVRPCH